MTYSTFARFAFPITLAAALLGAGWTLRQHPEAAPKPTATPTPASEARPAVIPPAAMTASTPELTLPPAGAVLTAAPGPGPEAYTNATATPGKVWLSEFDRALDHEFTRLDAREKTSGDPVELALVSRIKEKLVDLDALWRRADALRAVEEKMKLQQEAQQLMGEIIQLGRADRNQRLTQLARSAGVAPGEATARFIEEVDRAVVETHLDWAPLFNRGAVTSGE